MLVSVKKKTSSATVGLLISNALTLTIALILKWPLPLVMWPYWIQSIIVGWYARKRMLSLRSFSTEGFTSNDERVPENEEGKKSTALFFVMHYGFFHFMYFIFLVAVARPASPWDCFWIIVCGVSYAFAQRRTFEQQIASDALGKPNLGSMMFLPYLRVVPIHLTIIFGVMFGTTIALLIFMPIKTVADILLDTFDRNSANQV
ncbi:MAG: DUF6498-containing protein [Arenimonas sp.]